MLDIRSPTLFLVLYLSLLSYTIISSAANTPPCNPHDKAVLLKIKNHFGGPKSPLVDWDYNTDCCSNWTHVRCSTLSDASHGRVDFVNISRPSGLSGPIPSDFGDLPYLSYLSIAENINIVGTIPKSLSKLKRLYYLDFHMNSLSGPIPEDLIGLKSLLIVDLSGNKLSGEIPPSVSSSPIMWLFNVSHNKLSGNIPKMQESLRSYDVSYNQLCGRIPSGVVRFGTESFQHNKCLCGPPLAKACK